jgi:glycosyltransferase involved in cell wall biosynthesis
MCSAAPCALYRVPPERSLEIMAAVSKATPLISVVLCTRNRADLLDKAIASVVAQDFPSEAYEVLIVDNGSSDHTRQIADRYAEQPNIRYILEEEVGLCVARNTGWQAASASYVALFDDDAIARPGWLAAIARTFQRSQGDVGVIGGRIDPIWVAPRPDWLADEIAGALTIVDWGSNEKEICDPRREYLVGANMAAPKAVIAEVGGFHPWLDRVGNNLLSNGDIHLEIKIMRRGYRCLYVPDMAIEHLAPPERLTQAWFTKRFYWQGISDAVMEIIDGSLSPRRRVGLAARKLARLGSARAKLRALPLPTRNAAMFHAKCLALIDLGYAAGMLGASRH